MNRGRLRRRTSAHSHDVPKSRSFPETMRSLFSRALSSGGDAPSASISGPSVHYSMAEIVQNAQRQLQDLLEAKEALFVEAGDKARLFVARYIDPVLVSVQRFLGESIKGKATAHSAIGGVELLSLLHHPNRLRQKICETIREQAYSVLQEDISFLRSYPKEVLQGECLQALEERLYPLFVELTSLLQDVPLSTDFSELFYWRLCFDDRRQSLHDQIVQSVEEQEGST